MKRKRLPSDIWAIRARVRSLYTITDAARRLEAAEDIVEAARNAYAEWGEHGAHAILFAVYDVRHEAYEALRAAWAARYMAAKETTKEAEFFECYPPGFWEAFEQFGRGDAGELGTMVDFLEADRIAFRSGYTKAKIIRRIKPEMLTPANAARLQRVVLHVADTRDDRDFRAFCRLARKADGAELRTDLEARLASPNPSIRRRA